jgi:hypothetical protein
VQECNSLVVGEFFACFGELRKVYNDWTKEAMRLWLKIYIIFSVWFFL